VFFPSRMNASVSSGKFWKQEDDFIKLPHSLFTTQGSRFERFSFNFVDYLMNSVL